MKYRKLSPSGDYVFGQNGQDFYSDLQAIAQAAYTRLLLWQGTFWRDQSDGLPMFQSILSSPGTQTNLTAVDAIIQQRILGTDGVTDIVSYTSSFDGVKREYTYTATIQTAFSTTVLTGNL